MTSEPCRELGAFLTGVEAASMATLLGAGHRVNQALKEISPPRRDRAKTLLSAAGLGHDDAARTVVVLDAIAGAKSVAHQVTPVWTMPDNEAGTGYLTSEFKSLVQGARQSVTCATYNFNTTSHMWTVLQEAGETPGVSVTVYVDAGVADAVAVKTQLPKAAVFRSATTAQGKPVTSHAKFVIIDHTLVLLTSANFSWSAENRNIELGLRVHDEVLAASIETTMASKHGTLYEVVT